MRYPRLKDLREDHELMQKQVAAKLGIDQRVYSNYETGKREIPVHHLAALADLYHTSTDYLLGRIDYPKIAPEFSNSLIQNVTIGDFVCRIDSFNSKSKRLLVDYVNYLTYMENTEKLKKDDKTKNPIQ